MPVEHDFAEAYTIWQLMILQYRHIGLKSSLGTGMQPADENKTMITAVEEEL